MTVAQENAAKLLVESKITQTLICYINKTYDKVEVFIAKMKVRLFI